MDAKALIWTVLGLLLILGGIVSSLREGREAPRQEARPPVAAPPAEKKFDTGFTIDPVKGLSRKDENVEYFKK